MNATTTEYEILASMHKSRNAEIRVTRSRYCGNDVIDVRVWFFPKQGGPMVPSRRGIQIEAFKLGRLAALLYEADRTMRAAEAKSESAPAHPAVPVPDVDGGEPGRASMEPPEPDRQCEPHPARGTGE